jgi:GNAT superfamily N-acetyltransferase
MSVRKRIPRVAELRSFPKHQVPRDLACQIRSYIRIQWPHLNPGLAKIWSPPAGVPLDRMTFVLVEDELLISHAEVNFRNLPHLGQTYRVGGLSAVFTYPAHRGSGAGERVASAATDYLRAGDADFALLFCGQRVRSLYQRLGWTHDPGLRITSGDAAAPAPFDQMNPGGYTMSLKISARARADWPRIASAPLYVGPSTW